MSVSTSLRRIVRRSLKPFVMVALAMTLALSLTVTTTQRAEATPGVAVAPVIAAAEGVLAGGVRLALPSLLSIAIATTPVGWVIAGGLAIGALGVGLYSTKDYWLPFVTGAFGASQPVNTTENVLSQYAKPGFTVNSLTVNGNNFTASYSFSGSSSTWYAYTGAAAACAKPDGTIGYTKTYSYGSRTNSFTSVLAPTSICPPGWTLKGLIVGGGYATPLGGSLSPAHTQTGATMVAFSNLEGGATQYDKGPTNYLKWGTMGGTPSFDPKGGDVKYKTTAECIDDGGNKTSITAEWLGDEGGAKVPSCAAAGKGHGTGKMSIEGYAPTAPGVPGTVSQPIWETQAPGVDPDHPLCGPDRPGPGCEMKITIDGNPCAVGVWECENWTEIWKDPTTAPRVGCTYGPYTLAVDLCRIMEPAYRPGGAPATEQNMDADPATRNYTQPGGTTYTPPSTGTGTAPGGFPSAGVNPSTGTSPNCSSPTWSWNPVEFVRNPVFCTLQDAFIPKTDIQMRSDALRDQASEVVPISWLSNPISGPSGGGCPNWTINVAGLSKNVVCESSFTAALVGVRGPLFGLVAAAMVWPLMRGIWYASIPVLRVSPGSSK